MTFHVIFPAAGVGSRFGSETPKQYAVVAGKTVMEWTLSVWENCVDGESILAVASDDRYYTEVLKLFPSVKVVIGAETRAKTVLNALLDLSTRAHQDDWVLVHDVARLCVRPEDISKLIQHCQRTHQGGLLARKITDTVKQAGPNESVTTLDRDVLWAALTPQCFQLGTLTSALIKSTQDGLAVTDEASAMEIAGHPVHLIEGHSDNIKLTHALDVFLVEHFLAQQGRY